jgi:phospholipid-binding lipoprotein MlaA
MISLKNIFLLFLFLLFNAPISATESDSVNTSSRDFETTNLEDEIYDPFEPINRAIFSFNNVADKIILEPVSKGYRTLPAPVQSGIGNFISNLKLPLIIVNQLLQGQGKNAAESTGRLVINSTAGLLGLIDVANKMGLEHKEEDFGQTLASWGIGDGFYIVLPIFGPSNLRDTAGKIITYGTDPANAYAVNEGETWFLPVRTATNAIDQRAKIIDEVNALRNNSLDYYATVRSSYYQNRKAAILNEDDSAKTPFPLISVDFE